MPNTTVTYETSFDILKTFHHSNKQINILGIWCLFTCAPAITNLTGRFCPGIFFFDNTEWTSCHGTPLHLVYIQLGSFLQGCFMVWDWLSLRCYKIVYDICNRKSHVPIARLVWQLAKDDANNTVWFVESNENICALINFIVVFWHLCM